MITLSLSRLHLANGQTATIQTNTVSKEAKSGTKKNMMRTGIATGAGALIGGLAGGGKGAAIGAGSARAPASRPIWPPVARQQTSHRKLSLSSR